MKLLSIDVSGNFKEGKGTTGLCFMEGGKASRLYEIKAKDYDSDVQYWDAIMQNITFVLDQVVIEGYRLYNHKGQAASAQANSELETPQLIGAIKMHCFGSNVPLHIQYASEVKTRWAESVLVATNELELKNNRYYFKGKMTNDHMRDAMKHALHFNRYGRKKK